MNDLFDGLISHEGGREILSEGAIILRGYAREQAPDFLAAVELVTATAPFRHMITPGGLRMSVEMTNCGTLGWISDRSGNRYVSVDPESGLRWPAMPDIFQHFAARAAAEAGFKTWPLKPE